MFQKFRKASGFTQNQIAELLGVNRSTIAKWETGKASPRVDTLIKLAGLFNCTVDELLKPAKTNEKMAVTE